MARGFGPADGRATEPVVVAVPNGSSAAAVADRLAERAVIRSRLAFRLYVRLNGLEARLRPGEYALSPASPLADIVDKLVRGDVITYPFTVPEGYTARQIADLVGRAGLADPERFFELARTGAVSGLALRPPDDPRRPVLLEGYLFPSTYRVPRGTSEEAIIRLMVAEMARQWTPEMRERAQAMGWSLDRVLVLASMVERESQLVSDQPLVSAVFHNRLRRKMKLDANSTVNYALGQNRAWLSERDLALDSPYNTYRVGGLPPGPVGNPGLSAIRAALWPADAPYLYFVALDPTSGRSAFATTYAEHLRNVERARQAFGAGR